MVTTFSGDAWRLANDPQPGVQDNSTKGSFIPSFGDALYRKYRVPIGVASVGHGSTSVRQWLPAGEHVEVMPTMTKYVVRGADGTLTSDGTLFNGMMARIKSAWRAWVSRSAVAPGRVGFAPASGEHEITAETYRRMLEEVILATRRQARVGDSMVCRAGDIPHPGGHLLPAHSGSTAQPVAERRCPGRARYRYADG